MLITLTVHDHYITEVTDCFFTQSINVYLALLQTNTFQVVIAKDRHKTFVFFIYGALEWGDNATVGFDAGDGVRSFVVPGVLTNQSTSIQNGSNVDRIGMYIYRVDQCEILGPNDSKLHSGILYCIDQKFVILVA